MSGPVIFNDGNDDMFLDRESSDRPAGLPTHPEDRAAIALIGPRVWSEIIDRVRAEAVEEYKASLLAGAPSDRPAGLLLREAGHEPVSETGDLCQHRWRNRTSAVVHCKFLAGYRAALLDGAPSGGLDMERLRLALIASGQAETYAFSKRWADRIAAEYARLTSQSDVLVRDIHVEFSVGRLCECGKTVLASPSPDRGLREAAWRVVEHYEGASKATPLLSDQDIADLRAALLATPAAGLDVATMRQAIINVDHMYPGAGWVEEVAAEYARLREDAP